MIEIKEIIYLVLSYLIGSILFAVIISKIMNLNDPRNYGSNNAGATNVMRSGNKTAGILTFLGDFLKGFLVVIIAKYIFKGGSDIFLGLVAILVVFGHLYPIFFNFKGGKGVATYLGVIFAINVFVGLATVASWLLIFKLSKTSSLSAIIAVILTPIYVFFIIHNHQYFGFILLLSVLIIIKHKTNILRLIKRNESTFKK